MKYQKVKMKLCVVLPAFNEAQVIGKVLDDTKRESAKLKNIKTEIIVIDDGSTDKTSAIARKEGAVVLKHILNRGLGAALTTGIEYAKRKQGDILVTMDADGQHDPADLQKVIMPIVNQEADIVIGSRFLGSSVSLNWDRKIILKLSNLITFLFFGIYTTDSQSGFRAFSKKAIQNIHLRTQRMEVSSELFSQIIANNLKLKEVPIKVIYTSYSKTKGQSNLNAIEILIKLIISLFR